MDKTEIVTLPEVLSYLYEIRDAMLDTDYKEAQRRLNSLMMLLQGVYE